MRLASYNVENLFARPKAMDSAQADAETRRSVLAAHARLSALFDLVDYAGVEEEMLRLLETLGLLRDDEGEFVRLRKIRGQLLRRPRSGPVEVVAGGRADWVGWLVLKTEPVNECATENTARVLRDVHADVLGVVEADNRPDLELFSSTLLRAVGATPYEHVMLVEGNDARGIDVGLMTSGDYPVVAIRSHIYDVDDEGPVFSRDCCEYHLETPNGTRLVVMVNHFKSKGYSTPGDSTGAKKRERQARRTAAIYHELRGEGIAHVAVVGDLNDDPSSPALAPLLATDLTDVSAHPDFDWNHRRGTYGSGNERDKIDYILMSPSLFEHAVGGGVFRMGVWHGNRTKDPWDIYPTMEGPEHEASDHAALYVDLTEF